MVVADAGTALSLYLTTLRRALRAFKAVPCQTCRTKPRRGQPKSANMEHFIVMIMSYELVTCKSCTRVATAIGWQCKMMCHSPSESRVFKPWPRYEDARPDCMPSRVVAGCPAPASPACSRGCASARTRRVRSRATLARFVRVVPMSAFSMRSRIFCRAAGAQCEHTMKRH